MSSHILIVYGTSYGHTRTIAEHLRDRLANEFGVTLVRGDAPLNPFTSDEFDGGSAARSSPAVTSAIWKRSSDAMSPR